MGKISLRAYNHEIESLIERGHTEEAIAHCKYILKTYPKHLDTYRLLGKTYLESQRYSEAADILQRILSVLPDDFVAQIGMSIIREDEGNLDAAIYHMERAFEIQPSNAAIQDELRRLYGRRDGVEPPKLRLTRGALVRMYARGDLYRQAIAEARASIKEDPHRLDLEIVLAQMYYKTGKKAEAAEICSRLVTKLPYCLEANRILAEVLPETSRAEDAKVYQQRLNALDPYQAYLSDSARTVQQVPDQAVSMDELEWTPSIEAEQQPTWAQSLGVEIDQQPSDEMPGWLDDISTEAVDSSETDEAQEMPQVSAPSHQEDESGDFLSQFGEIQAEKPEQNQEGDLPDWMQSSGWTVSEAPSEEQPDNQFMAEEEGEALPGDLPAWLKGLAPSDSEDSPSPAKEEQSSDWLSSFVPEEQTQDELPKTKILSEIPDETPPAGVGIDEDQPEWLNPQQSSSEDNVYTDQSQEPLPDWLTGMSEREEGQDQEDAHPAITDQETASPLDVTQPSTTISDVEQVSEPQSISADEGQPSTDLESVDDAMSWLEGLAAKQGADEETLLTSPEDRIETPPEWVAEASRQTHEDRVTPEETSIEPESEPSKMEMEKSEEINAIEEIPGPSSGMETSQSTEQEDVFTTPPPKEVSAIPQENISEGEGETGSIIQEPALEGLTDQVTAPPAEASEEQALPEETGEMDMDSAFAWLESLAAKQGASEDSLLVNPEDRQEAPPDWVQTEAVSTETSQPKEESVSESPEDELPGWLKSSAVAETTPESENQPSEESLPDWLKMAEEPEATPTEEFVSSEEAAPVLASDKQFPTEEEVASPVSGEDIESAGEEISEPVSERPLEEAPTDWVQGIDSGSTEEPEPSDVEIKFAEFPIQAADKPSIPEPEPTPGAPERLASDAAISDTQPTAVKGEPSEETPPLPDWLRDEEKAEEETPEIMPEPVSQETDGTPPLPDWLKDLEAEQEEEPISIEPALENEVQVAPENVEISSDPDEMIFQAQAALEKGQIDLALSIYDRLVQQDQKVDETIHDLRDALYRFPVESAIYQTLGDAYIRANQVQDALDAYTKAEELLK